MGAAFIVVGLILVGILSLSSLGVSIGAKRYGMPLPERPLSTTYREYMGSAGWRRRRRTCLAFTFDRDCVFPWWPATDVDHLYYKNLGHEIPIRDIVPLNHRTHCAVTLLRRRFGRRSVNALLQLACGMWMAGYLGALVAMTLAFHWVFVAIGLPRLIR